MEERKLTISSAYDSSSQAMVGIFAAQLDDQLKLLKSSVKHLETNHLEWQPQPGMNTIGMLLAHLAVVEVFWINVAAQEIHLEPDGEAIMKATIGINMDDDGLPSKPGDRHPATLQGKTIDFYLTMLDKARAKVHEELRTWSDNDLPGMYTRKRGDKEIKISRMWTLYHVLEHFSGHFGQILLLKHLMRDAGVLVNDKDD